jgi:hypothetical protein
MVPPAWPQTLPDPVALQSPMDPAWPRHHESTPPPHLLSASTDQGLLGIFEDSSQIAHFCQRGGSAPTPYCGVDRGSDQAVPIRRTVPNAPPPSTKWTSTRLPELLEKLHSASDWILLDGPFRVREGKRTNLTRPSANPGKPSSRAVNSATIENRDLADSVWHSRRQRLASVGLAWARRSPSACTASQQQY